MNTARSAPRQLPIVPSKNALRALRRLAFSTPVLIASTITSVCGIATLNHEVYRRIHLAEKALESKRVLRSISNGRGAAHMKAMFEAAERGEDFPFGSSITKKRRRQTHVGHRDFSAMAVPEPLDDADQSVPREHPRQIQGSPPEPSPNIRVHLSSQPSQPTDDAPKRSLTSAHTTKRTVFQRMRWSKEHVPATDLYPGLVFRQPQSTSTFDATALQADPPMFLPLTPPYKSQHKVYRTLQWANELDLPFRQPPSIFEQQIRTRVNLPSIQAPDSPTVPSPVQNEFKQPAVDTRPIHAAPDDPGLDGLRLSSKQDSIQSYVDDNQTLTAWAPTVLRSPLNQDASEVSADQRLVNENEEIPRQEAHILFPAAELDVTAWAPAVLRSAVQQGVTEVLADQQLVIADEEVSRQEAHIVFPAAELDVDAMMSALLGYLHDRIPNDAQLLHGQLPTDIEVEDSRNAFEPMSKHGQLFAHLCSFITMEQGPKHSQVLRYSRWLTVLRYLCCQNNTAGWKMADAIFDRYGGGFVDRFYVQPVFSLIQHLLATAPSSRLAQQILFRIPEANVNYDRPPFEMARRYLQYYCDGEHTPLECLREWKEITKIARQCNLNTSTDLAIPVLRTYIRNEDFETTEDVLEELAANFDLPGVNVLLQEYTFLNASNGKWNAVDSGLERLHNLNRSRLKPADFGRLFERVLSRQIATCAALESFNFTINAMKYTGLTPTKHVSRMLVSACIRDGRYDLAAEWLQMMRQVFPRFRPGCHLLQGAWFLADTLADIGASCEEIAKVCHAIAYGCRREPFGPSFRIFTVELIKTDLSRRLHAASAQMPEGVRRREDFHDMTLAELLEYTHEIRAAPVQTTSTNPIFEGLRNDIAVQIAAVVDLAKTFRGDLNSLFLSGKNQKNIVLMSRRTELEDPKSSLAYVKKSFPQIFGSYRQPLITEAIAAMNRHYQEQDMEGHPVDHTVLKYFITQVGPDYPVEVLELVEAVSRSKFASEADGTPFDIDIFRAWLYLVSKSGTARSATHVLSAVVEAGDRLEWKLHFKNICEFVTQLGEVDNDAIWEDKRFPQKPASGELRTLYESIKRINKDYRLSRRLETFKFPGWKGWDMDNTKDDDVATKVTFVKI